MVILLESILPTSAWAQTFATPPQLQLALEQGLANNPELQILRQQANTLQANRLKADQPLIANPELSLQLQTGAFTGNPYNDQVFLQLAQELELGGQQTLRQGIALSQEKEWQWQILETQRKILGQISQFYWQLSWLKQKQQVFQELLELSAQFLQIQQRRLKADDISAVDAESALIEDQRLNAQKVEVDTAFQNARLLYFKAMGSMDATLDLVQPSGILSVPPETSETLFQKALKQRPALQVVAQALQRTQQETELVRRNQIPNLTAAFGVGYQNTLIGRDSFLTTGSLPNDLRIQQHEAAVGINLGIPLKVLSIEPELLALTGQQKQLAAQSQGLKQEIRLEINTALVKREQSRQALLLYQKLLPHYDQQMSDLFNAYAEGQVNLETFLATRERYWRAKLAMVDLYLDYTQAGIELDTATGDILQLKKTGDRS